MTLTRRGLMRTAAPAVFTAAMFGLIGMQGCASRPRVNDLPDDAPTLAGRLALRVAPRGSEPARSTSAHFELRGDARLGELRLTTPLGTTAAHARWAPGQVSLLTGDGSREFDSLDALATEALGEALPLAALFDWLRGKPWPGAESAPLANASGNGFEQLGWAVDLARLSDGWVQIHRAAAPAVDLRVILDAAS